MSLRRSVLIGINSDGAPRETHRSELDMGHDR